MKVLGKWSIWNGFYRKVLWWHLGETIAELVVEDGNQLGFCLVKNLGLNQEDHTLIVRFWENGVTYLGFSVSICDMRMPVLKLD